MTGRKTAGTKSGRKDRAELRRARRERLAKGDSKSFLALLKSERQPRNVITVLPGVRLRLRLNDDERRLVLDDCTISMGLTERQSKALEKAKQPELNMTLADWDDFMGYVASASNHARDGSKLQRRAEALSDRVQELLDSYTDEGTDGAQNEPR